MISITFQVTICTPEKMYHYEMVQELPVIPVMPLRINLSGCISKVIQESTWDHERGALVELKAIDLQVAHSESFEQSMHKDLKDGGWKLVSEEDY